MKRKAALILTAGLWYLSAWLVLGDQVLPFSPVFSLLLLYVGGMLLGWILTFLHFPQLFGMLIAGLLIGNFTPARVPPTWSSLFRLLALSVILLRGGLGISLKALVQTARATLLLTFLPAIAETLAIGLFATIIIGMPFLWSLMLGFGICSISPAVIVPLLVKLQDGGYGVEKGIPTMILAASGLDDVFGVTGFTIVVSILFSTSSSLVMDIVHTPIELVGGTLGGFMLGFMIVLLHRFKVRKQELFHVCLASSAAVVLVTNQIRYQGAGAFATLLAGCIIANYVELSDVEYINRKMDLLWDSVGEPILFVLVGSTILFENIDTRSLLLGIVVILLSLIFRCIASYTATFGGGFTQKERLFVCMSWIPKTTVQAAMASIPLDLALQSPNPNPTEILLSYQVLTILVLSIFITAPIGASLVHIFGPRLLEKNRVSEEVILDEVIPIQIQTT